MGAALEGAIILSAANGVEQLARLLRNIILARILLPEHFGTATIIIAATTSIDALTELGTRQAIIHNPECNDPLFRSTALAYSLARGALLAGALLIAAPWLATFFGLESHLNLFRLSALIFAANSLTNPSLYVAERRLEYNRVALATHGGSIVGIVATIVLSFALHNPSALVIGMIAEAVFKSALSHCLFTRTISLRCATKHWSALRSYSMGMIGLPIFALIFTQGDVFVIGKTCGVSDVARFVLAASIASAPFAIVALGSKVLLPVFANKQRDLAGAAQTLERTLALYLMTYLPGIIFVVIAGAEFLKLLYGPRFEHLGVIFTLQYVEQLFYSAGVPLATLYMGIGKPELYRQPAATRAALIVVLVPLLTVKFGIVGAGIASCAAAGVGVAMQLRNLRKLVPINTGNIVSATYGSLIWSMSVAIAGSTVMYFYPVSPGIRLCIAVFAALGIISLRLPKIIGLLISRPSGGAAPTTNRGRLLEAGT